MTATEMESAVVRRMLADDTLRPVQRVFEAASVEVTDRERSAVGFISSFRRTGATKLFADGVSLRWGRVMGRVNAEVDVDFVVYVDDGYIAGVECVTFGGEPFPVDLRDFELTDLPRH